MPNSFLLGTIFRRVGGEARALVAESARKFDRLRANVMRRRAGRERHDVTGRRAKAESEAVDFSLKYGA